MAVRIWQMPINAAASPDTRACNAHAPVRQPVVVPVKSRRRRSSRRRRRRSSSSSSSSRCRSCCRCCCRRRRFRQRSRSRPGERRGRLRYGRRCFLTPYIFRRGRCRRRRRRRASRSQSGADGADQLHPLRAGRRAGSRRLERVCAGSARCGAAAAASAGDLGHDGGRNVPAGLRAAQARLYMV